MVSICFYFQVHQPFRLRKYRVFDIGKSHQYFDEQKNREVLNKVAEKCYLPANKVMQNLLNTYSDFKLSFSFSGAVLEQFEKYNPEVLHSFQELADTGRVEILDETYHHSLSSIFSRKEFNSQIKLHTKKVNQLFNQKPKVFRNTELIFSNEIASKVEALGYKAILAEGWDPVLQWRSPNFIYRPKNSSVSLLLKNYRLSDDIAFRFSNKSWSEHPLTVPKYAQWINVANGNGQLINLFMDYETLGEHQWADTGIFKFMENLPPEILKHRDNNFVTPSEAVKNFAPVGELDFPYPVSWADTERDLSAWTGNKMQLSAINKLYGMENSIKRSNNKFLMDDWRKLQCSDHFYYMCTKWFNDGDVHKYFNPYDSPYECYIAFMNVMNDMAGRIDMNKTNKTEKGCEKVMQKNSISENVIFL